MRLLVIHLWRNESLPEAKAWIADLARTQGLSVSPQALYKRMRENGLREFFTVEEQRADDVVFPEWVEMRFQRDRPIDLFQHGFSANPKLFQAMLTEMLTSMARGELEPRDRLSDVVREVFHRLGEERLRR